MEIAAPFFRIVFNGHRRRGRQDISKKRATKYVHKRPKVQKSSHACNVRVDIDAIEIESVA